VPVGAGDTFLAAMQQGKIVSGMTTEPTVARAVKNGTAKVGMICARRTRPCGARRRLSGRLPLHGPHLDGSQQGGPRRRWSTCS